MISLLMYWSNHLFNQQMDLIKYLFVTLFMFIIRGLGQQMDGLNQSFAPPSCCFHALLLSCFSTSACRLCRLSYLLGLVYKVGPLCALCVVL